MRNFKSGGGKRPKNKQEAIAMIEQYLGEVCKGIMLGMTITDACRAAGVDQSTFYRWMQKKDKDPDFAFVEQRVDEARAKGQMLLVSRVVNHSKKDWRAAAWILERRHPDVWAPKNNNVAPIDTKNTQELTNEEKQQALDSLKAEYKKELAREGKKNEKRTSKD